MSPQDFAFWLQGFIEIENPEKLDKRQTQIIKDHLKLVFEKETPNRNENDLYCAKMTTMPNIPNTFVC